MGFFLFDKTKKDNLEAVFNCGLDLSCATNNIDNADKAKTLSQVSLVVAVFGGGLAIYEASKGSKAAFPKYLDGMSLRGNGEKIMLRKTWRW